MKPCIINEHEFVPVPFEDLGTSFSYNSTFHNFFEKSSGWGIGLTTKSFNLGVNAKNSKKGSTDDTSSITAESHGSRTAYVYCRKCGESKLEAVDKLIELERVKIHDSIRVAKEKK
jgi:hypothetical protein